MAGPSLSHILDPPRPGSDPQLDSTSSYPVRDAAAGASSTSTALAQEPAASSIGSTNSGPPSSQTQASPTSSRPGHSGNNLYACRDCGRSYSRPEHLVRHVQTHTLGRRFACDICKKSFARKDLLRRHVANHENDTPNKKRRRTTSSPGPGRVSQACRPCATARVKCDDTKPCQRCINRKLTCVSSESGSTAAMHLVHLSANAHTAAANPLAAASSISGESADSSPASHCQPRQPPASTSTYEATNITTPISQSTPLKSENSQLPTPDTGGDQGITDHMPPPFDPQQANIMDFNHVPFFDFLRDVLYQQPFDPSKLADPQGLAVLDFCDDTNMELTDMDFGLLDHWNLDPLTDGSLPPTLEIAPQCSQSSAEIAQMRQNLVKAWTESPWQWDPANHDSGYKEQGNLPVPVADTASVQYQESRQRLERVIREKLDQSGRDRVLAIVLSTCRQNATTSRVAASFPSLDVMDTMVHIFLASHACQVSSWIHFPTFSLNNQWPEWIGVAAAAGAVLIPVPTLRKFGFAVQEAVRITIPARFEENNTAIQNLGLVQSLVLGQDLGLWSGNRRKMEIAECHLVIPVTMMRYRRKFQRSTYPVVTVDPTDEGAILEEKWRLWVGMEQWKRLVFHCYIREAQISMTALTNPCMSYAELTLPLPEPRELWFAQTASEWKAQYLQRNVDQTRRAPSVGDLFHDIHLFLTNNLQLDMQFSISIFLHGFWSLILEYRQLSAVHNFRSYSKRNPNLLLSSRHQELVRDLQTFQFIVSEWQDVSAQEHVILNLLMMNLHVSLDDLQIFSGKEGEDQARRVYPVLQEWASSSEARSAVWYAGQILRHAKFFPSGHLKDFYAVAVHHASLALWTYGVVIRANRQQTMPVQYSYDAVYLDGSDANLIQRFLGFEQGRPLIRGSVIHGTATEASLYDPRLCMEITQEILQSNFKHGHDVLPSIVENLCGLIKQLGNAAWAVGLG